MATITSPSSLSASTNIQADDLHGGIRDVEWISDLSTPTQKGFYGNRTEKIIFYRDKTVSDDASDNYWLAWEDGKTIEQMEEVRWDDRKEFKKWFKYDASQPDGWARDINNKRLFWNGLQFSPEL